MIKFGQVTAYNAQTGIATIAYVRPDACAKCGACGTLNQTGTIELKANCNEGDWVKVVMPDSRFLTATAMAYGLPLCCFLLGIVCGYFLSGKSEGWAFVGSFIGIGIGLLGLKLNEKYIAGKADWTPHVAEVYDHRPEMDDLGCGATM